MVELNQSYEYYNYIVKIYDSLYMDNYWINAKAQTEMLLKKYVPIFNDKRVLDMTPVQGNGPCGLFKMVLM
ncbi:MAG: hypothetical protein ACP5PP_08060 [Fervidobacterium sp.]